MKKICVFIVIGILKKLVPDMQVLLSKLGLEHVFYIDDKLQTLIVSARMAISAVALGNNQQSYEYKKHQVFSLMTKQFPLERQDRIDLAIVMAGVKCD